MGQLIMAAFRNIRGLLPASMLDWPGKISAVLFLGGCNFRCPYCHNPELVEAAWSGECLEWEHVAGFLQERAGWIDGVCVTGGEPTIHRDLPELCSSIKALGMEVKVDTNGSRPRMLRYLLERDLVDFIAMDFKTSPEKYPALVGRPISMNAVLETVDMIITWGGQHEFRCTVVPGWVDYGDLEVISHRLHGASSLVLQQFRPEHTLDPVMRGVEPYPDALLMEWSEKLSGILPVKVRGLMAVNPA